MKDDTKIDWRHKVDKALIKLLDCAHLPLRFDEAAKELASSPYCFHRQFKRFTGETFKACLDRIRLEKAMMALRDSSKTVTEIAYECGYANSEMLSKALKKIMGLSPTKLRELRSWHPSIGSKINFHYLRNSENKTWFYINGGLSKMTTKIINFKSKTVYGYICEGNYWQLPALWEKLGKFLSEKENYHFAGECMSVFPDHGPAVPEEKKKAAAGFVSEEAPAGEFGFEKIIIPEGLYAVTVHYGSCEEIGPVWERWLKNWQPDSGWQIDYDRPNYEWYQNQPENPELQLTFLVTPVKK